MLRSISRREKSLLFAWGAVLSDISFFHLLSDIVGGPPGQSVDGEGWIFVRVTHKGSSVADKEISSLVGLTESIQRGSFWIRSHPYRTHLVNDSTGNRDTIALPLCRRQMVDFASHGLDDGSERLLHVAR